eukprot:scaffold3359_cov123-Cylindrotheca_fusiformis.AAC.6
MSSYDDDRLSLEDTLKTKLSMYRFTINEYMSNLFLFVGDALHVDLSTDGPEEPGRVIRRCEKMQFRGLETGW